MNIKNLSYKFYVFITSQLAHFYFQMSQPVYEYCVVQVTDTNGFPGNGIFVVPADYLMRIDVNDQFFVKYLRPPFSEEDIELTKGIVATKGAHPPEDWTFTPCSVLFYCSK